MRRNARVIHAGKDNLSASAPPGVTDDSAAGYGPGSVWATAATLYICLDATTGAAVWKDISAVGGGDVTAGSNIADHAIVRGDGGAKGVQASKSTISDAGVVTHKDGSGNAVVITPHATQPSISMLGDTLFQYVPGDDFVQLGKAGVTIFVPQDAVSAPLAIAERSSEPSAPISGDIYLDDGTNTASGKPSFRRYTGSAWEDIARLAAKNRTITKILYIEDPVAADSFPIAFLADDVHMVQVRGVTDVGTVTFNIERRTTDAPDAVGTDVLSSDLPAVAAGASTTAFAASGVVVAEQWLNCNITSVATSPTKVWIALEYTID